MMEKSKKEIEKYLSKSKYQHTWNEDWSSGLDATHSILLHKDI